MINRRLALMAPALLLPACGKPYSGNNPSTPSIYESFDGGFDTLIDEKQDFEVLGQGYGWSEGPSWDKERNRLYFTDVPGNIAYQWHSDEGVTEFLSPSGAARVEGFREPGANGLLYRSSGKLLICNHGKRAIEEMDLITKRRKTLTKSFEGKAFNSPNDIIENDQGDIFFTDPPYGLDGLDASPLKELPHNGVYKFSANGRLELLISDLSFPNGVALSPDQKTLYVAQSDPRAQHIYTLDLSDPSAKKRLWVDLTPYSNADNPGLPDGMAVDQNGNIFATGPGGIFVISNSGKILGRIKTGKASANCAFGEDGRTLFITNHDRLLKLRTSTRGVTWT